MKIMKAIAGATVALAVAGTGWAAWAASDSGHQRFFLHGEGASFDLLNQVVASGPISGVGQEQVVEDHSEEGHQNFTAEWAFPKGTISVEIQGTETTDFNPVSCAGAIKGHLHWTITGGSDAYAGASGSGSGTYVERFVVDRGPDGCLTDQAVSNVFTGRLSAARQSGSTRMPPHSSGATSASVSENVHR